MSSDQIPPPDGPDQQVGDVDRALLGLLGDAALWEEPGPQVEDAVAAAIAADGGHPARARWDARRTRDRRMPAAAAAVLGVAAAVVLLLVAVALDVVTIDRPRGDGPASTVVLLEAVGGGREGTVAEAAFQDLPDGTRIELQASGLPPAPEGQWYEMSLLRPGDPPVSAGSFHMRGGGGRVVLWAGIGLAPEVVVEITRQPAGTTLLTGTP